MGELSLSELLGKGIGDGDGPSSCPHEPELAGRSVRELVKLLRDRRVPLDQQDRVLAAVIRCYRRHHTQECGNLLLALMAPALVRRFKKIEYLPAGVEEGDLRQQVVLETLRAADSMPIPEKFVQRRIESRVYTYVRRWMKKTARHQHDEYDDVDHENGDATAEMEAVIERLDLQQHGITIEDLRLAYRCQVGGETAIKLGLEYGMPPKLIRSRLRRVLHQLHKARPELLEGLTTRAA